MGEAVALHTSKFIANYGPIRRVEPNPILLGAIVVFDGAGIVGPTEKLDPYHYVALNNARLASSAGFRSSPAGFVHQLQQANFHAGC